MKEKSCEGLGLRKLEPMNTAFLAKIGWRIMQNEDTLLTQVLKTKYKASPKDCSSWIPKHNMSNAWKGILKSIPVLKEGCRIQIRNGKNTSFWHDSWIGNCPLENLAITTVPASEIYKTVASYWTPNLG